MENAGAVQHRAAERGWAMGSVKGEDRDKLFGHLRPIDVADREEREARGQALPATYRHILGPTPKCRAGDTATAKQFVARIQQAIDSGHEGREEWSTSEWARLYRLRSKWQKRANGEDARFMEAGNVGGTPNQPTRAHIKIRQQIGGILEAARGNRQKG